MLVRAFRLTDRLGNALLRIAAWAAISMTEQAAHLKDGLVTLVIVIWQTLAGVVLVAAGTARVTRQTAKQAYEVSQEVAARRQERMAQRVAESEVRHTVVQDPLRAQNRALSAFAVILLLILLAVVVVQTTSDDNNPPSLPSGGLAQWPQGQNTPVPTALFPTATPTATPVPDPLRVGGSLVYALRENSQEDLWAISVGEPGQFRLTNSPADERDPAWSPDGARIAFSSNRDGNWELYLMDATTLAITRLTFSQGFEGAPTWSPDGLWLAYEGYYPETQDLDIYIISTDPGRAASEGAQRATFAPGPDIEPAWGPDGRNIAFTSWRTGNQDILILSLNEDGGDARAINLTATPDIHEDHAAWSNDGGRIAYTATVDGIEGVYARPVDQSQNFSPTVVGRGKMPVWAPNDGSIAYALDIPGRQQSQILAGTLGGFGAATDAISLSFLATDPDWSAQQLPRVLVNSGGIPANPETSEPLYEEQVTPRSTGLYGMALLNGVVAPQAVLCDRVNDSFEAMRERVLQKAGYDFFGTLEDAFWPQGRPPDPGEPRQNWHYAGRAIAFNRNFVYADVPAPVEIVREDVEVNTYWRVYLRVVDDAQNGMLGEPVRRLPWDFAARASGDVGDYEQGGRLKTTVPPGYYIDLTQLAEDFGWQRVPAQRTWQFNFGAIQFWELVKTHGLTWETAMLEIYSAAEFQAFLSEATPVPPPPPLPTASPTPDIVRSPTPIPPDLQ